MGTEEGVREEEKRSLPFSRRASPERGRERARAQAATAAAFVPRIRGKSGDGVVRAVRWRAGEGARLGLGLSMPLHHPTRGLNLRRHKNVLYIRRILRCCSCRWPPTTIVLV